jgi:2-aminoadipate transaminase
MLAELSLRSDVIPLAAGMPSPDILPVDHLAELAGDVIRNAGPRSLQYAGSAALPELQSAIERQLAREGIARPVSLVTNGSQQALDLVGRVMLDPGDIVAIEAPSYPGAFSALTPYQPRLLPVEVDENGVRVDRLEEALRRTSPPKLLYVVSTFSNPSSISLSTQRRRELLAFCRAEGILVVEDNPYGRIRFEGCPESPLVVLDPENVVSLGSLSKIVAPALRVGWALAPEPIAQQMKLAKEAADLCLSPLSQLLAAAYLDSAWFESDLAQLVEHYRVRRDAMLHALDESLDGMAQWTRPEGGFFVWLQLGTEIDTDRLLNEAIRRGIVFMPGSAFYSDGKPRSSLRLSYSTAAPTAIHEGVLRLAALCREHPNGKLAQRSSHV